MAESPRAFWARIKLGVRPRRRRATRTRIWVAVSRGAINRGNTEYTFPPGPRDDAQAVSGVAGTHARAAISILRVDDSTGKIRARFVRYCGQNAASACAAAARNKSGVAVAVTPRGVVARYSEE